MAVYRPKRKGETSKYYICEFVYLGKRVQESTGVTTKTLAKEYEKRRKAELERAAAGLPNEPKSNRIRTVTEVIKPYTEAYGLNHRPKSVLFAKGRLAQVGRRLGTTLLSDLTEERIRQYIRDRRNDGASGRTINMELGELSRAMGQPRSLLWPKVRQLEERKDVGRALSPEEQKRLLDALKGCHTPHLPTLIPLLLLTGMRAGEALALTWGQVDLIDRTITVGRAQTSSGTGRTIPINAELCSVLAAHRSEFVESFGESLSEHFLFAWGSPLPSDPTRHITDPKHGWEKLRERAGVEMPPSRSAAHLCHSPRRKRHIRIHDAGAPGAHERRHAGTLQSYPDGGEAGRGSRRLP